MADQRAEVTDKFLDELRQSLYEATNLTFVQRHHLRLAINAYEAAIDGVTIGPITHDRTQCIYGANQRPGFPDAHETCDCWCIACTQHNDAVAKYAGFIDIIKNAERDGLTLHVATRDTCAEHLRVGDDVVVLRTASNEEVLAKTD